jgi:cytochrome c-type biogenesis protein CcmH/NrfG
LNVELFPQSANAYDSLGEAYMRNGQRALAIENYQRSLALDPGNANAERMLAQLR